MIDIMFEFETIAIYSRPTIVRAWPAVPRVGERVELRVNYEDPVSPMVGGRVVSVAWTDDGKAVVRVG